jgi:hypothetical protein
MDAIDVGGRGVLKRLVPATIDAAQKANIDRRSDDY